MCIIIYNKTGKLESNVINESSKSNPDGAGIMYSLDNKLHVFKNRKNNIVIDEYRRVRKMNPDILIVLHFRIATDGGVNHENCHPYMVNSNTALAHNGILTNYTSRNTSMSDTRLFIKDILGTIESRVLWRPQILSLVRQAIGYGNKIVMLRSDGESVILNEHLGYWDEKKNNWFSNSSYKTARQFFYEQEDIWYPAKSTWNAKRGEVSALDTEFCDYCGRPLYSIYERDHKACTECIKAFNVMNEN